MGGVGRRALGRWLLRLVLLGVAAPYGPGLAEASAHAAGQTAAQARFVVDTAADLADPAVGDGRCGSPATGCTLRAAIEEANRRAGPDLIAFAIPGDRVHTIRLAGALPALTDATGGTTIDGYTQPGARPNTDPLVSNAQLRVQVAGAGAQGFDGLSIESPANQVRGLAFFQLRRSLWLTGSAAHHNSVVGNFIGTDASGLAGASAFVIDADGVQIIEGAHHNQVGGTAPADRNIISGNARHGVGLWHAGTERNTIINNLIGLAPRGDRRLANRKHGVDINEDAAHNYVGGRAAGARNVVSGNAENGVEVSHGAGSTGNQIVGNFIGTDVTGNGATAYSYNGLNGVMLEDRVVDNLVAYNVIGNNDSAGVEVTGLGTQRNQVAHNYIGIAPGGGAMPNRRAGIEISYGSSGSLIGPLNIIANNRVGILVVDEGTRFHTITQNSIFGNSELGIDLAPRGSNAGAPLASDAPNQHRGAPVLSEALPSQISGSACVSCTVELFWAAPLDYRQGKRLLARVAVGPDGVFRAAVEGLAVGGYVTATATDALGNTSEFADSLRVGRQIYLPLALGTAP